MKTSMATVSLSGTLPEKIAAIKTAGFDGVEIFEDDLLAFSDHPSVIRRIACDCGLDISIFQPFRDFEGLPEPHRSKAFDQIEYKFDLMGYLGVDLILVCSNTSPLSSGEYNLAAEDLRELGERAAKRNIQIGFEALSWGLHISEHRDAWEVVRRVDHPNVGLVLDSFHTLARGIDVHSISSIPKNKIFFVQLADASKMNIDLLNWSRQYRNMPGEGDLAVEEFTRSVIATGYNSYFSLEIFNTQYQRQDPGKVARKGYRLLLDLDKKTR